jgi:NTE family protein
VSSIMTNNLLKSRYAFHALAHHSEVIPIVPEFTERIGTFSTEKMPHAIEMGEEATRRELPQILRAIEIAGAGGG